MLVMEMSRKEQQIPAIRFNGFTDAWEQRKLGDVYTERNKRGNDSLKILSVSIHHGVSNEELDSNILGKEVRRSEDKSLYKHVYLGDLVLNMMRAWQGAVGVVKSEAMVSPAYITAVPSAELYPLFMDFYLRRDEAIGQMNNLSYGVTDFRKRLYWDSFVKVLCHIPTVAEQERITVFFTHLDDTIALHQRQLDNYKALKKVMLQKIFNQELRFKDQEGNNYPDWEKMALNELGETYTGLSGKTKEDFGKGKGRFVTYMNVYSNPIADLAMTENVEIKDGENQNEVCYGDIFFTTSSETPEEVGMSSVWLSHESKVYLNSFCFGYRLSSRSEGVISPDFLGFQLRAPHIRKKIIFLAQGSTRFNISKSKLMDIVVYMPTIEEQNKITAFLLNVDSRIKHTIQSIERLNMLKKALLQQMFI